MLFAGAQSQDETAFPLDIDGLADETAGYGAHVFVADGEKPDMGATEGGGNAEALPVADDNICAQFPRRFEKSLNFSML